MTELPDHINTEEGVHLQFRLEDVADVRHMFITAGPGANQLGAQKYVMDVIRCMAEMVGQGLHVRDVEPLDLMSDIEDFHQKFGLEYLGKPRMLEPDLFDFRSRFMGEELTEWRDEQPKLVDGLTAGTNGEADHRQIAHGLEQQLDALVDLTYVVLGTAYLQFGPAVFREAWRRVQAANMAKVRAERKEDSIRGSTWDVVKPKGWMPPDHHDLVRDHAHIPYRHPGPSTGDAEPSPEVVPTAQ